MFEVKELSEIFIIDPGQGVSLLEYIEGNIPYISESACNNGVRFYINPNQIVKKLDIREKVISVGSKTGIAFYHPYKCIIGQQTASLKLKRELYDSEENLDVICQYLVIMIERQTRIKASFGYQVSTEKLPKIKILIPMANGKIDVEFIKEKFNEFNKKINHLKISNAQINNKKPKSNWQTKILGEIFSDDELFSATTYDENKLSEQMKKSGNIPYVTRTAENNGIKAFLSEDSEFQKMEGNCISIGLDTQTVFYQENDFYCGQNIIIVKTEQLNKYNGIFMAAQIEKEIKKFSWGSNGATLGRLKRLKIMLPILDDGSINYKYMEEYIKNLKFSSSL